MSGTNVRPNHAQPWVRHSLVNGIWLPDKEAGAAAPEAAPAGPTPAVAPPQGPYRRRSGYRPEWVRGLSPLERLTDAAMSTLLRDRPMREQVARLAGERPPCLAAGFPARLAVAHADAHASAGCRAWLNSTVALCREVGCPSLEAMLFQIEASSVGLSPGSVVYWGLRAHPGKAGPRRPVGQIDSPARLLLARRWHHPGTTWEDVSERLGLALGDWIETFRHRGQRLATRRATGLMGPPEAAARWQPGREPATRCARASPKSSASWPRTCPAWPTG